MTIITLLVSAVCKILYGNITSVQSQYVFACLLLALSIDLFLTHNLVLRLLLEIQNVVCRVMHVNSIQIFLEP